MHPASSSVALGLCRTELKTRGFSSVKAHYISETDVQNLVVVGLKGLRKREVVGHTGGELSLLLPSSAFSKRQVLPQAVLLSAGLLLNVLYSI